MDFRPMMANKTCDCEPDGDFRKLFSLYTYSITENQTEISEPSKFTNGVYESPFSSFWVTTTSNMTGTENEQERNTQKTKKRKRGHDWHG